VIVFVLALVFFITPALLGGGRVMMIAVLIEQQVRETLNWPFAAALRPCCWRATLVVYALAQRFMRPGASVMTGGRRPLVAACSAIYIFLMLPLPGGFPDLAQFGAYMAVRAAGLSWQCTSAIRDRMDRCHGALVYIGWRRRCWRWRSACRSVFQPGARHSSSAAALPTHRHGAGSSCPPSFLSVSSTAVRQTEAESANGMPGGRHTVLALPFVVLVMVGRACAISTAARGRRRKGWVPAARRTLARITLPLLRPSLVSGGAAGFHHPRSTRSWCAVRAVPSGRTDEHLTVTKMI